MVPPGWGVWSSSDSNQTGDHGKDGEDPTAIAADDEENLGQVDAAPSALDGYRQSTQQAPFSCHGRLTRQISSTDEDPQNPKCKYLHSQSLKPCLQHAETDGVMSARISVFAL